MIATILSIKLFVNTIFKDSFEKYVDDSNKVEVNHLIEFDLKNLYTNESWNTEFIEGLGIEAIEKVLQLKYMIKIIIRYGVYLKMKKYYQIKL